MAEAQARRPAHGGYPDAEPMTWRCPCGETRLERRYGGPADHQYEPDSPCEPCVMESFAEYG